MPSTDVFRCSCIICNALGTTTKTTTTTTTTTSRSVQQVSVKPAEKNGQVSKICYALDTTTTTKVADTAVDDVRKKTADSVTKVPGSAS